MVELVQPEVVLAPVHPLWVIQEVPQIMAAAVVPVDIQTWVEPVVVEVDLLADKASAVAAVVAVAMELFVYLALMVRVPILFIGIVLREAVVLG